MDEALMHWSLIIRFQMILKQHFQSEFNCDLYVKHAGKAVPLKGEFVKV